MDPKEFEEQIRRIMTTQMKSRSEAVRRVENRLNRAAGGSRGAIRALETQANLPGTVDYIANRTRYVRE